LTMGSLRAGKLSTGFLRRLLGRLPAPDSRVILGPRVGEDAAVIDFGDRLLVAKTDPITFATDRIGWYLVHVNANDLACLGARPRWLLVTCLLPEGRTDTGAVESLFDEIARSCSGLGVTVCGGHTEVTVGLERPILVGQMLGEVSRGRLVDKRRIRPGDVLLLTKGVAIEGTAVIARERADVVRRRLGRRWAERAARLLFDPGISVVRDAEIVCGAGAGFVHGMHDPTEGGVLQALRELAESARVGLRVRMEHIPVYPETRAVCDLLGLDPLGLLASGCLLVAADPAGAKPIEEALRKAGVPCSRIGEVCSRDEGVRWTHRGRPVAAPRIGRDELVRVFEDRKLPKSSKEPEVTKGEEEKKRRG